MICEDVSGLLLDAQRGRLAPDIRAQVAAHLQTCRACFHEGGAEQLLTEALEGRLPRHAAPGALKRRLVAEKPGLVAPESSAGERWRRPPRTGTASGRL
jgi:anti-sigma factor RsiW